MKRVKFIWAILILASCKKDTQSGPSIYVSGSVTNFIGPYSDGNALQWVNGNTTNLQKISTYGLANSIFVSGTDVYVAGVQAVNGTSLATYWKNGEPVVLSDSNATKSAVANCIFISGADVYVAGYELKSNGVGSAVYWKNGVEVNLTPLSPPYPPSPTNTFFIYSLGQYANATGIAVSSTGDVYVAGTDRYITAAFWKNGVITQLADTGIISFAQGLYVSGSDVYVAGIANNTACYWKNGVFNGLPNGSSATANAIFVSGSDILVAGNGNGPVYWKNGSQTRLGSNGYDVANGIFEYGNDVYVAGTYDRAAVYWKNGVPVSLSTGPGTLAGGYSWATSVYVK
ncbi:MAG TPA: hypothetical protein VMI35_10690 [Puia sp.]|nr:hypothetical protein [Puia sp.]